MQRVGCFVVALAASALALPAPAWAFCRTYTCEFDGRQVCDEDPVTRCQRGGELARWASGCVSYAVQVDGSDDERISAEVLSSVLEDGFRAWSDAECPGPSGAASALTPPLTAVDRGLTGCDSVEYNCGGADGNANIVMFRDAQSQLSNNTIALSTIIANLVTGEILDVDIEINSQDFDFYVDSARASDDAQDLRLVLNHELGHMLGLSHSRVDGALMRAEYDGVSFLPAADDVGGICAVLPGAGGDPACAVSAITEPGECVGEDSSCPVAIDGGGSGCVLVASYGRGSRPGAAALGVAALAWVLRRRKVRARASNQEQKRG